MKIARSSIGISLLLSAVLPTITGCQGRPVVHGQGSVVIHDGATRVAVVFSDVDRRHIHDYYHSRYQQRHRYDRRKTHVKRLPPGLARREQLPPGLAKRDRLPPGLSGERLPHALESRLSPLPAGVVRLRIGTELVLMDQHTRVVLDVIKDIPLD
jgi:hypothetical protein